MDISFHFISFHFILFHFILFHFISFLSFSYPSYLPSLLSYLFIFIIQVEKVLYEWTLEALKTEKNNVNFLSFLPFPLFFLFSPPKKQRLWFKASVHLAKWYFRHGQFRNFSQVSFPPLFPFLFLSLTPPFLPFSPSLLLSKIKGSQKIVQIL